jgi:hypothetical protein
MTKRSAAWLAAALLVAPFICGAAFAQANPPAAEAPASDGEEAASPASDGGEDGLSEPSPECHVVPKWRAIMTELGDEPGMIILINARDAAGKPDCATSGETADHTIGGPGEATWFVDLAADHLVANKSTGPVGSVQVHDLVRKTVAVEATATEMLADWWGVTWWEHVGVGTKEDCPDLAEFMDNGLSAALTRETRYDYAGAKVLTDGRTACEPVQ